MTYTVTVNASENGTVTASKTSGIAAGETITLTVMPGVTETDDYELGIISVKNGDAEVDVSGSGSSRTFTMPVANVTVSATFTKITYIGSKKPSRAKQVGDIVFTDGSASPYTDGLELTNAQKAAAIAVVFYKGTGLNNDDDTSTERTLGVGLVHGRELMWCNKDSAAAYKTNITTTHCPASGSAGAHEFTGHRNGSDNFTLIGQALASDDTTTSGEADRYPAFYFARDYKMYAANVAGTASEDDWYVPSIAEVFQVWKQKTTLDAVGTLCETDTYGNGYYWSSSQIDSNALSAYVLNSTNGYCYSINKSGSMSVCIVRAF